MGLVTSKQADDTYQPKGEYALVSDLGKYQPKGSYATIDELKNISPFKPLPRGNGGYMTTSKTYDVDIAGKSGMTKGNAIVSLEEEGIIGIQSLNGNGGGSNLMMNRTQGLRLNYRNNDDDRQGSSIEILSDRLSLNSNKYCFRDTCFTQQDMESLYNNLPVKQAQSVTTPAPKIAPSKYLRTRNYLHY